MARGDEPPSQGSDQIIDEDRLSRRATIAARLGDGAMQLNDDVREFFANYCRAFEALTPVRCQRFLATQSSSRGPTRSDPKQ